MGRKSHLKRVSFTQKLCLGCGVMAVIAALSVLVYEAYGNHTVQKAPELSNPLPPIPNRLLVPVVSDLATPHPRDPHDRFQPSAEFFRRELVSGIEPLPDYNLVSPNQAMKDVKCTPGLCDGGCYLCCSRYGWCGNTDEHCVGPGNTDCRNQAEQKQKTKAQKQLSMQKKRLEKAASFFRSLRLEALKALPPEQHQPPITLPGARAMIRQGAQRDHKRRIKMHKACMDVVVLAIPRSESSILRNLVQSTLDIAQKAGSCLAPNIVVMRPQFDMLDELSAQFPELSVIHGKYEIQDTNSQIKRRRDWGSHPAVMAKQVMQQQRDIINMLEAWKPKCRHEFILVEDDFTWCTAGSGPAWLSRILSLATIEGRKTWSAVRFSHGLGGVMLQCRDIVAIQKHLITFMGAWPPDALVGEFLSQDCTEGRQYFKKRKYLAFKNNLMQHMAKSSTLLRDPAAMQVGVNAQGQALQPEAAANFKFPACFEEFQPQDAYVCSSLNLLSECFQKDACFMGSMGPSFVKDDTGQCMVSERPVG